jgi:hypothetical protein
MPKMTKERTFASPIQKYLRRPSTSTFWRHTVSFHVDGGMLALNITKKMAENIRCIATVKLDLMSSSH